MFQYDYLYSAAMCIKNGAVPPDGGWISYDFRMSAQQLQLELTLNQLY